MNAFSLLLVGQETDFHSVAREAAARAFPGSVVTVLPTLDAALQRNEAPENELLALPGTSPDDIARAAAAIDRSGLPRWPVVVFGSGKNVDSVEILPPADWERRIVARVFQAALERHRLRRENARCRGDLATIGVRVSHDMRSPLGCILTTSDVLRETLTDELPSQLPFVRLVSTSAEEMVDLVERLGSVARASLHSDSRQPVNMGMAVWAALQRLDTQIIDRKASIVQPTAWPAVQGNGAWLETAWWNLISNSLEHGGPAPRIEIGWNRESGEHRFWIRDSGAGVPPEKRAMLFQPFHLLHEPNAVRGLGLPIVRRLIELQGGRCGYEAAPNGAPRFFFTLPIVAEAPPATAGAGPS